jgi:Arc/MetJ-type ribon-helix-helix transcriptional regulator
MTTIHIDLPDALGEYVAKQAATAGYASANDFVLALLREALRAKARAELEAKLLVGVEELNRGEGRPWTKADFDALRADLRARYGDGDEPCPPK